MNFLFFYSPLLLLSSSFNVQTKFVCLYLSSDEAIAQLAQFYIGDLQTSEAPPAAAAAAAKKEVPSTAAAAAPNAPTTQNVTKKTKVGSFSFRDYDFSFGILVEISDPTYSLYF